MDEKPFNSSLKKAMDKLVDDSTFITTGVPEKVPTIKKVKLPKGLVDDSMFICPDD